MKIWKDIENYEGLYQVSNYGEIKNIKRNTILKLGINKYGYCYVILNKNNKSKWHSVHRLVAKAFIDNINNNKCVNHKDENKQNNKANNLEWCTYKYNNNYGTRVEKVRKATSKKVIQYDSQNNFIKIWSSIITASINTNTNRHSIVSCCKKKQKTAGGYKWEYAR